MKRDIFGKKIEETKPEYVQEKMNPFEAVELITRYNYLNTTDVDTFYYVMKRSKSNYYTETIHLTLDDAKNKCAPGQKIAEKRFDPNLIWMVIKILANHPQLVIFSQAADSLMTNIGGRAIMMMLEQEIPKKKYYIRYNGSRKRNDETFKLISKTLEIDSKNVGDCLEIVEAQKKTKEFLKHFETGGRK